MEALEAKRLLSLLSRDLQAAFPSAIYMVSGVSLRSAGPFYQASSAEARAWKYVLTKRIEEILDDCLPWQQCKIYEIAKV